MNNFTPIINIIGNDPKFSNKNLTAFTLDFLKFSFTLPRNIKGKKQFFDSKLGKGKLVWSSIATFEKIYYYQNNDWCVYISKKGFTFEVLDTFNSQQAIGAWNDFLNEVK